MDDRLDTRWRDATGQAGPRVWVIAELGVNHDGDAGRAAAMIEAAAAAGADAVKTQLFDPGRLLSNQAELAGYQRGQADDARGLLAGLRLTAEQLEPLRDAAAAAGLGFVVTPFSPDDVEDLERLGCDAVKIASPDAVNRPLVEAALGLDKPVLVSTGAADREELRWVAERLTGHSPGGALMQCVSSYPTPVEQAGLSGIGVLRGLLSEVMETTGPDAECHDSVTEPYQDEAVATVVTGYSDHTVSESVGAWAVCSGAVVLEKHLTHDRDAAGPDHAASLEPAGFGRYVTAVRRAAAALGPRRKSVMDIERDVRRVSRQSVAAARDLPAGHRLKRSDLTVMRPGTGIPAAELSGLVGRTLRSAVGRGDLIDRHTIG